MTIMSECWERYLVRSCIAKHFFDEQATKAVADEDDWAPSERSKSKLLQKDETLCLEGDAATAPLR